MDERRKVVGRRIKRDRRKAGFTSQRNFAEAIGASETAVAYAETGDPRVGVKTFALIEDGLGWPDDSITRYLNTGDETVFVHAAPSVESEQNYNGRIGRLPQDKQQLVDQLIAALTASEPYREYENTDSNYTRGGSSRPHQQKSAGSVVDHSNGPRKRDA